MIPNYRGGGCDSAIIITSVHHLLSATILDSRIITEYQALRYLGAECVVACRDAAPLAGPQIREEFHLSIFPRGCQLGRARRLGAREGPLHTCAPHSADVPQQLLAPGGLAGLQRLCGPPADPYRPGHARLAGGARNEGLCGYIRLQ